MILKAVGEDPQREGLVNTPERVERMYAELCAGYKMDLETIVNGAIFTEGSDGMVMVRNVSFYSLCEHHMLPFFGRVHLAYIPDGKVIGLSKIPRIVEMYARRLQIQERMTNEIHDAVDQILHPKGIALLVEGQHMCSMMRGVKKEDAVMETVKFSGVFAGDATLRREFYQRLQLRIAEDGDE